MTKTELAWAAGLFEGEGTVRINKATWRNLGHLCVSVCNTDREVVEFFQVRWPGYLKPATGLRPDQRPAWVWVIAARRAAAFLRDVAPFIQTTRVAGKIKVGLEFQDGKSRCHAVCRAPSYAMDQFASYLYMRELNVRGRR